MNGKGKGDGTGTFPRAVRVCSGAGRRAGGGRRGMRATRRANAIFGQPSHTEALRRDWAGEARACGREFVRWRRRVVGVSVGVGVGVVVGMGVGMGMGMGMGV